MSSVQCQTSLSFLFLLFVCQSKYFLWALFLVLLSSDNQLLQHVQHVNVPFGCSQLSRLSRLAFQLSMNLLRSVNFPRIYSEVVTLYVKFPCVPSDVLTLHVFAQTLTGSQVDRAAVAKRVRSNDFIAKHLHSLIFNLYVSDQPSQLESQERTM